MPPASLAHFKHRAPPGTATSANGNAGVDHTPLPPNKRARESPAKPASESAPTPPRDGKNLKVACRISPPTEEKKIMKGKMPCADPAEENYPSMESVKGNYHLSDAEVLDCAVCCHPLSVPVYQCKNGHTACPTCWSNLERAKKKCHSCDETTWDIRCLVMEKMLEHLEVLCHHSVYGCSEFLEFLQKKEHEEFLCKYRPYRCPIESCRYEGPKPALLQHFDKVHQMQALQFDKATRKVFFTMHGSQNYKLLQSDQELYVLFREVMPGTIFDIFYCASFGPYRRNYLLSVELRSDFQSQYSLRASVPEMKALHQCKLRREYLIVPNGVEADPARASCLTFDIELELYGPVFQVPARIANSY